MAKLTSEEDLKKGFFRLSWGNRIGYGIGDLAQNLIYQTISVWLLFFYTNIFGLDPAAAATMFLVVRIVDVCWDPCVGTFIDKHNTKLGKYRAYLIFGGIPLTIFAILCFFNGFSGNLFYAYFTYVAMSMCYTLVNVPYCALNACLTREPNEVTVLTNTRMWLSNVGAFAVSGGIPFVVSIFSADGTINTPEASNAWFITMTIFSIAGFILLFACFCSTKERIVMKESDAATIKVKDLWGEFFRNRQLRIVAFFFLVAFSITSISNAAGSYFMTYNMNATSEQISIFMALSFIPVLITLPLIAPLKRLVGKKGVFYILIITAIIGMALLYFVSVVDVPGDKIYYAYVAQVLKSAGIITICGGYMWALIPDLVTYGEYPSGRRIAGMVTAITGIFFKAGVALGGAVPGFVLAFVGFDASQAVQTEFAEQGILWLVCVIPCILLVIAMFIISKYHLTDDFMFELNDRISTLNSLLKSDPEKNKIAREKKLAALKRDKKNAKNEENPIKSEIKDKLVILKKKEIDLQIEYEKKMAELLEEEKRIINEEISTTNADIIIDDKEVNSKNK